MRPTTLFVIFTIAALGFLFFIGQQMGVKAPQMPSLKLPQPVTELMQERDETGRPLSGFYKWQDASGAWHYGDRPPQGVQAQSVDVDINRNILASPQQEAPAEAELPAGMEQMPGIAGSMGEAQRLLGMDPAARQREAAGK